MVRRPIRLAIYAAAAHSVLAMFAVLFYLHGRYLRRMEPRA